MEDHKEQIPMKAFSQLKGLVYKIPSQQRGYKWTPSNVKELISDLWEFINAPSNKRVYCLQPLAVVPIIEKKKYSVLDGQQRLTTLFLLYKYLTGHNPYTMEFVRDFNDDITVVNRWKFLSNVSDEKSAKLADEQIDLFYIHRAYQTISECFESLPNDVFTPLKDLETEYLKNKFVELLDGKGNKSVQVIWYEVPKEKSYETFRNLNSGKISLTNTELIKALFLNRASGLNEGLRDDAARQFEEMEQIINNDHFWAMLSSEEPIYPHTRMDLLFNLIAEVDDLKADKDFRSSFRLFASEANDNLEAKWQKIRHTFLRIYDMYKNIYTYHYIGYLTYCNQGNRYQFLSSLLETSRKYSKTVFVNSLRERIRQTINPNDKLSISDFEYGQISPMMLRRFFLLHNIETILQKYETLKSSKELNLQHEYEQFPFELLHKQSWDIEHITSQTDSKFDNEQDRKDWLSSVRNDYPSYFEVTEIKDRLTKYDLKKSKENFDELYKAVIMHNDKQDGDHIIDEGDKNQVGNLVLLDSHTNRSFHNSLFPRKRRIVVIANGLKSEDDEETNVTQVYIPPCTMQCFTKAYSKKSSTKLNSWLQPDADAYREDIKQKLCDKPESNTIRYFKN
ncbi:MAG: DUF262 domain-containing protein [Paludibacteraceae bacterium]|nr:DUF262 domain-containing protein [Paludibacteraceae bacterium]